MLCSGLGLLGRASSYQAGTRGAVRTARSVFSERSRKVGCFLHSSWYTCASTVNSLEQLRPPAYTGLARWPVMCKSARQHSRGQFWMLLQDTRAQRPSSSGRQSRQAPRRAHLHVAPSLPHHPHRRPLHRVAAQRTQQQRLCLARLPERWSIRMTLAGFNSPVQG